MPEYLYKNPKTGKVRPVLQRMTEEHTFSEGGLQWERVFTIPCTSAGTRVDPFNSQQFVAQSYEKNGTMGDLFDKSRELSEKRAEIAGKDPVRQKFFDRYSKKRKGKKHPEAIREELHTIAKAKGIEVEL